MVIDPDGVLSRAAPPDRPPHRAGTPPLRAASGRDLLGWPVAAFAVSQILWVSASMWYGFDWRGPQSRIHWDGGIYVDIAQHGYHVGPCAEINPSVTTPGAMCGNAHWFPLYPFLVRLGSWLLGGAPVPIVAVAITEACALGMLIVLWSLLGRAASPNNIACLALAALLPSGEYFHATFPMSLTVLLVLLTFLLLIRDRWVLAGIVGALAATAYPVGVLLAPAAGAALLIGRGRWRWRRLAIAGYVSGTTAAGVLVVFSLLRVTTGRFDMYLVLHRNYGAVYNPLAALYWVTVRSPPAVTAEWVFSAIFVAVAVWSAIASDAGGRIAAFDRAIAVVYGPLVFLAPLFMGYSQSQVRPHALLLPLVVVLRDRPAILAGLIVAAIPIGLLLSGSYVANVLV